MKNRKWLLLAIPLLGTFLTGIVSYSYVAQADQPAATKVNKVTDPMPIRQVVLFNSGVGYFQREGEVDGDARLQLSFPTTDINDLLKSLVLQDAKGRIGTVNYDSSDPIDKILRSFALDLTANPTFGQILNQARGEKIEISHKEKLADGKNAKLVGTIIGIEVQKRHAGKDDVINVEILNLNTATGLQAIPMEQVVSVRFQNPTLETEFQRALNVLATSHDTQKKTVSIGFNGEGKRSVRVGYVVERPIWKTSYRLRMEEGGKAFMQGWALVENTSDDDWNDVRMVLVSGKPISFKMNLYDPIYVPRPFVEPETFASLRPPTYNGAMPAEEMAKLAISGTQNIPVQVQGSTMVAAPVMAMPQSFVPQSVAPPQGFAPQSVESRPGLQSDFIRVPIPYPKMIDTDGSVQQTMPNQGNALQQLAQNHNKLTYEELQRRRQEVLAQKSEAKKVGSTLTGFNFKEGIQSVATADEIGDYYQYTIDQKVTLPRQKSAMLPILDQSIDGTKVSIFNESTHAKYPLLGLKLKNTSGQPLTQGPITVYDGGVFAGDTRILDLQPNEERFLSYALDQSTEIKTDIKSAPSPDLFFRIGDNNLTARYYVRQTKTYTVKNRSTHDRTLIIEHPIRGGWKLQEPKKAGEQTRDLYRFQTKVPAGKTEMFSVVEDMPHVENRGNQTTYDVVAGINVKVESALDYRKLVGVRIHKGFVLPSFKTRETKAYFVQNLSDMDRTFTVDHVVRPGWARLDDKNEPQNGPDVYRFKMLADKGKSATQAVREERSYTENGTLLKNLSETQIRTYMAESVASADVKAAFTKSLTMQAKLAETQKQIAEVQKQLDVLTVDHTRVRENLKIVPSTSEHYKAFLEKFVAQDKQIETFQQNVREFNATMQTQLREYDQFIAKLDAE